MPDKRLYTVFPNLVAAQKVLLIVVVVEVGGCFELNAVPNVSSPHFLSQ